MDIDGSITIPVVAAPDGTFSYVLKPASGSTQFSATREAVDASAACAATVLGSGADSTLVASNISRMGQSTTITFAPQTGLLFTKISATASGLLDGYVGGHRMLAGGTVTVRSASGTAIATGTTNAFGAIDLYSTRLPDAFKVTVTGGTWGDAPLIGTLKAEIQDYTTVETDVSVTVDPLTTLVAAYHERYPDLTLDEAIAHVRDKLSMPAWANLTADNESNPDYFDETAFYGAVQAAGSVDALVTAVLDDWGKGTVHNFVPVPAEALAAKAAIKGAFPPQIDPLDAAKGVFSVAGVIKDIYSWVKENEFKADVINKLRLILDGVNELKGDIARLSAVAKSTLYETKKTQASAWENSVNVAFKRLTWLATNPVPPQPTGCPIPLASADIGNPIDGKAWIDYDEPCIKFMSNRIETVHAKSDIRQVTKPLSIAMGDAWTVIPPLLSGSQGMLQLYRENARDVSDPSDIMKNHTFFTYEDSARVQEHFRYWKNIEALLYFFYSEQQLLAPGTDLRDFKALYDAAIADQQKYVPTKQLSKGMYVDIDNTDFDGVKVGGPVVWWLPQVAPTLCNPTGQYAFSNSTAASTEFLLATAFNCYNSAFPAAAPAAATSKWRVPTVREMEAFTQVRGYPDRNVGEWLASRGIKGDEALWLNDKYIYMTAAANCSKSVLNYASVSCLFYPYPFVIQSIGITTNPATGAVTQAITFLPFVHFNVYHNPVLEAGSGYLVPVRDTVLGEFY